MERKITLGSSELSVFENELGNICIRDSEREEWIYFDECCAEKICKMIMDVAQEIRSNENAE